MRKIIHIDMDAFYASVEQRDNPELKGKPVAVGGSRERGVVAAASYEARRFGVRSAMPSVRARRACPELIFVRPRFDVYKDVSRQIRAIFLDYTPLVEPLSLDEAYLDVTSNLKNISSATAIASDIKARILQETRLTASAGVSYNKLLAKLASDYRKPDGLFVIPPSDGPSFVETLPVGKFHGIGPVTAARMNKLGIETGRDLRQHSEPFLRRHFGKAGLYYYRVARGEDDRPVMPDRVRKSIGSETTFEQDLRTPQEIAEALTLRAEAVWDHCERHGAFGRTVTVKVTYADFQKVTRSHSASVPVADKARLQQMVADAASSLFPLEKGIRLLGVTVSNLDGGASGRSADQRQLPLDIP